MSLRRTVRQVQKDGAVIYAQVEDIQFGFATVRLGSANGPRITQLPVLGGVVAVGERVIVDYSAGVPPVVRPITVGAPTPAVLPHAEEVRPEGITIDEDVSIHAYMTQTQILTNGEWKTMPMGAVKFDTHTFWDEQNPSYLTLPYAGFYFFVAHIRIKGWPDFTDGFNNDFVATFAASDRARGYFKIEGDEYGEFAYNQIIGNDLTKYQPGDTTCEVSGFLNGSAGERVYVKALNETGGGLTAPATYDYYCRIMGHRLSRGGRASEQTSGEAPLDDSDIEIKTDEGYLHVSDTAGAYARAIANATDTSNEDLTLDFRFWDVGHGADFRVFLRASRDWYDWQTPTKAYEIVISNTGSWQINRIEGGSRTPIGSYTTSATGLQQKLHFKCLGTQISASTWLDGESEPSWQKDIDDSGSGFTTAGTLQVGLFQVTGDHKMDIDNVNLTTAS